MIEKHFLEDPSIWVAFSFIIFVGLAFKPLRRMLNESLENKIENIKTKIEDSEIIKENSIRLLKDTENKMKDSKVFYETTLIETKNRVELINKDSRVQLEMIIKKKNKAFNQKISQEKALSNERIKRIIINSALDVAKREIINDISSEDNRKIINNSLQNIELS